MKRYNKSGFTLIELLAVIIIIMVLVALLMPALYGTQKAAKKKQSAVDCLVLKTAIVNYKMDKREWPVGQDNGNADKAYGFANTNGSVAIHNAQVINIIINEHPPYLDIGDFKTTDDGSVIDPWGDEYIIKVDNDYDSIFTYNGKTNSMPEGVNVTSRTYPQK